VKTFVIELGMVVVNDLGGTDAPTPDMILRGTVVKRVLMPSSESRSVSPHLDLPLQHAFNDLTFHQPSILSIPKDHYAPVQPKDKGPSC